MGTKAKKKNRTFTPKQILLIVLVAAVLLLTIIAIAMNPTGKRRVEEVKNETGLDRELRSEKDVIEYYESVYFSTEVSKEGGYDLDIYLSFKYNLYTEDESNEQWFKNMYERIAYVTGKKSFRLIDNTKNITVAVKCNSNGIYEVKINGELDYFRKEDSKRSLDKNFVAKTLDLSIDSEVLKELIDAKWDTKNVNLGTKEGSYYKYDIYFDEGYEIRSIQGKLFNIVFTNNYSGEVVSGFKVGTNPEKVEALLGTTFKEDNMVGYKTKEFYVWFSEDEISIYPIYKNDYKEFEELAKKYNKEKNPNEFMYDITDIWPDYDLYEYSENYVKILYSNRGVSFEYSVENPVGIKLYENYTGSLRENITDYQNIYYSFDKNLTGEREVIRKDTKVFYDDIDPEDDEMHYSSKFQVRGDYDGRQYRNVKIQSTDNKNPNNEFDDSVVLYSYAWADDTHLVYSVSNDGIYLYDAIKRTTEKFIEGKEEFNIESYHRGTNTMVYDGKRVKVEY